jgi:short-subunit dehydrogenase
MNFKSKVILITGVSSGLGQALANYLHEAGHTVYGTVRRMPLHTSDEMNYLIMDVTHADTVEQAVKEVMDREGHIDVLICNAGTGIAGPLEHTTDEEAMKLMDVNFMGVHRTIRTVLPHMRQRENGTIICINSIGGLMGLPYQGFYSASKFALEGYCQALRLELRKYNINVVSVYPGDFSTAFTASRRILHNDSSEYTDFMAALKVIEESERAGLKPHRLARRISHIITSVRPAPAYIVATPLQKFAVVLKKWLPQRWFGYLLGGIYKVK